VSAARRIGILGGSFDPIHLAHLELGRTAVRALALDELRIIPAGQPWQRAALAATPAQRLEMVRLATANEPIFRVDSREIERNGPTYTIDTVTSLVQELPQATFWLILGGDQIANFTTWRDWRGILNRCRLAVAERAGNPISIPAELAGVPMDRIPMPAMAISATAIRAGLAGGNQGTNGLLPQNVLDYIRKHNLYEQGGDPSPR
jgi:nicotinate-nucleotide adenylyltransferase